MTTLGWLALIHYRKFSLRTTGCHVDGDWGGTCHGNAIVRQCNQLNSETLNIQAVQIRKQLEITYWLKVGLKLL